MKVYTYSQARQRLASLLNEARRDGKVQIRRRDGQMFVVQPAPTSRAALDVPGVKAKLPAGELAEILRETRESGDRFWNRHQPTKRMRPGRVGRVD